MKGVDVKGIVAVVVVLGSFGLMGIYAFRNQVPDVALIGIVGTALGLVLGFYFGHVNGVANALATNANTLAAAAITAASQRRGSDLAASPAAPIAALVVTAPANHVEGAPPITP